MSGLKRIAFFAIISLSTLITALPLSDTGLGGLQLNKVVDTNSHHSRNLIGNQLGVINLASQNSAVNNGNTGGSVSHSQNTQNSAQQIVTDAQSIDVLKNVDVLDKPLILA